MMSNDVIWPAILDLHLGFFLFLKKSRNSRDWDKIKPECLWNVQIGKNLEFDEENWKKKYINVSKKSIFGQTYLRLAVAMETSKMMGTQLTYQNFYKGWMNSHWRFQPLGVNRLFKILKKPYCRHGIHPPFPLVRHRVMGYCKEFCIHWASTALNNIQRLC